MKLSLAILFLATFSNFLTQAEEWRWEGVEILGHKKTSRAKIRSVIPLQKGEKYRGDKNVWRQWCAQIRNRFDFFFIDCSAVRYNNFKAFFIVEIVEFGEEWRLNLREKPQQKIPLASPEILESYQRLDTRLWALFSQGKGVQENSSLGYLNYSDPEMAREVQHLISSVPAYRLNLLKVLQYEEDAQKRATAARLLNWGLDVEKSIQKVHNLLDDPDKTVRNNISRFMLHYFSKIKRVSVRKKIVRSLGQQLWRISHGDRNKALYGLLEMATQYPQDQKYIKKVTAKGVAYFAEKSILPNVKNPAQELLTLWEQEK